MNDSVYNIGRCLSLIHILESKSLKLYLFSFRSHGAFHEDCVNIIMKDLIRLMNPKHIEVQMDEDTVWLSQQQMADLYQTSRTNVVEHIKHIYEAVSYTHLDFSPNHPQCTDLYCRRNRSLCSS